MQNTILLIVVVTIVTFALALVFAGILTREKHHAARSCFRVIFYIPNILSVVVISGHLLRHLQAPNNGMLNSLLSPVLAGQGGCDPVEGRESCHDSASSLPWSGRPSATTW